MSDEEVARAIAEEQYWHDRWNSLMDEVESILQSYPYLWKGGDGNGGYLIRSLAERAFAVGLIADYTDVPSAIQGHTPKRRLIERDGWKCHYCNCPLGWGDPEAVSIPEIEHVIPKSRGGKDAYHNLVLACEDCNDAKGAKTPFEWLGADGICCEAHLEVV